jgi:hypothetical protein
MNNISFINNYLQAYQTKNIIYNCNNDNQYCMSGILYYINKYLWNYNEKKQISEKYLSEKYFEFLDCYIKTNCKNQNPSEYCYNVINLGIILEFIYSKINKELTSEQLKIEYNNNYYYGNDPLSIYIADFSRNNKSIISDNFIGFYEKKTICGNCQIKAQRFQFNNNNNIQYKYRSYYNFIFDINEINNFYSKKNYSYMNNMYMTSFQINNNNYNNINIYNCFDYVFRQQNKKYQSYCNFCFTYSMKYEYENIYSLPNILSIVLSNNENYNFIVNDELDLKQYSNNNKESSLYSLISILCQTIYNKKYICYCINPNNSVWYSYSDGKINEVEKMDINAIPLIAIYQLTNTIDFE